MTEQAAGLRAVGGLAAAVEALLFASPEPLSVARLALLAEAGEAEVSAALRVLDALYGPERGIRLAEMAGGYQLVTRPEHAAVVERLDRPRSAGLSRAGLETLAIIAYRQPITRAEIEAIRGVKVDRTLATLIERRLVRDVGRREGLGRPILYGTTREFLQYFGLRDLKDLPSLEELGAGGA